MRWQAGTAADPELRQRYVQRYVALLNYLSSEDYQHPQPVRALLRRELPNLRRALEMLLQQGEIDAASDLAGRITKFLSLLGMTREHDQMLQRITAVAARSSPGRETLTRTEYGHEIGIAEDERKRGNVRAAFTRLTLLLTRLQAQPQGTSVGPGSYEHSRILAELGLCLRDVGQYAAAETRMREALSIADALVQSQSHQNTKILRANVLSDLGTVLRLQGHYAQAKQMYEHALIENTSIQDIANHAGRLSDLGTLALEQRDYAQAKTYLQQALEQSQELGEPAVQAIIWHQLGDVAQEQQAWAEAERCYRNSLILEEQQGNIAGAARVCNELAIVVASAGQPAEAEGWYQGARQRLDQVEPGRFNHAVCLNNLADLLVNEVQAGRAAKTRLAEARNYAEQARRIKERPGVSSEIWKTFGILARIADLQGNPQEAQSYYQQERESYAAFAGNRYHMQQQGGSLIATIVVATRGDEQARVQVEDILSQLEDQGRHIRSAIEHIWAGERDWRALTTDLNGPEALLILLVLEALEESPNM